jgi:transcriptional regulator with XRE-family HTH domain
MNNKKSFGEFIALKRKEAGLTQKSFAEKLFVTESAVSKWERGISFPDITLVRDICENLHISEHELLTASEDLEGRNIERIANKYIKIVKRIKVTLAIIYGITILTCFICNLSISHTLSWFFIATVSVLVAFSISLLPVMLQKNRVVITILTFFTSTIILLLVCNLYVRGNWFWIASVSVLFGMTLIFLPTILSRIELFGFAANHKALICFITDSLLLYLLLFACDRYTKGNWFITTAVPVASVCLPLPWSMLVIIRYTKINRLFKSSACIAAIAVFDYFIYGIIGRILKTPPRIFGFHYNFRIWNIEYINGNVHMIIFLALILLTVLFAVGGILLEIRYSKQSVTIKQSQGEGNEKNT